MPRRSSKDKRQRRGVTLFEVLIVVAILALVSSGVAVAAIKYYESARRKATESNAREIRAAVRAFWFENEHGDCPGVDQLISDGALDRGSPRRDAWGEPWRIECLDNDVNVISAGNDRKLGTPDDIRAPPT
jgi:prepilin-type N-terminal cleavage/methylation domain-containing protein